jgi:hypothetical protein
MEIKMLAELAIANAAFKVIQQSLTNGKELFEMGEHLAKFSDAGREIDKKAKLADKSSQQESDLELFMAQESMKNKREKLKEMMIRTRHMMWDDFLRFEGEQAKSRARLQRAEERLKAKRTGTIITVIGWIVGIAIVGGALFGALPMLLSR